MIFQNMELYNVSEIAPLGRDNAYKMLRVPSSVAEHINDEAQRANLYGCGVELRFVMKSDTVSITMCTNETGKFARLLVYFGGIQAGWSEISRTVTSDATTFTIHRPSDYTMTGLEKITRENNLPFDPRVVRVILLNHATSIIGVADGEIEPPTPDMVPKKHLLCYGSSITHGSLALDQTNTYAFRTAENLGYDLVNLGYAGSAQLDAAMADYIATRGDADIITLEMGINVFQWMPADEFRRRAEYLIEKIAVAHSDKPVYCIDMFYCDGDLMGDKRADQFRDIIRETVEKLALPNTMYINGKTILDGSWGLSGDLGHPNMRAHEVMSRNLTAIIRRGI